MEHYYTNNADLRHEFIQFEYRTDVASLKITTDAGVFSKERIDFGSRVLLDTVPKDKNSILDMGCGYGIIGLVLGLYNPNAKITMADINERATDLARKNVSDNGNDNIEVIISNGYENIVKKYEMIVSNPPIRTGKAVIYKMFEDSFAALEQKGEIYIVIQKKQGAESAKTKLKEIYGNCEAVNKEKGYWILKSIKNE